MELDWARVQKQYLNDHGIVVPDLFVQERLSIYECEQSDYRFYHPVIEGDEHFYSALAKGSTYYPVWKWEHQFALEHISTGDHVLEIGCGAGDFLLAITHKRQCKSVGLELGEARAAQVAAKGVQCLAETIQQHSLSHQQQYDIVCFFQVLEHISDPLSFLRAAILCLRPGGRLILAVPNNTPFLYGCDVYHTLNLPPHHQGLWGKTSISSLGKALTSISLLSLSTEPLSLAEIDAFLKIQRSYGHSLPLLKTVFRLLPKRFWLQWAGLIGMEGRNLAAVFIKNQ